MTLALFERVALSRDHDEFGLKKGDIATLIDFVPHPGDGEEGCILEVFNALGESLDVVTVPKSSIEKITPDEVPAVRRRTAM